MRTLLLAERPFRDLRSRALIGDLPARLALAEPLLVPSEAAQLPPGFAPVPPDAAPGDLGIRRVVLAGSHRQRQAFPRLLAAAAAAVAAGARLELLRFSVESRVALTQPPEGAALLDAAIGIEVREHVSADRLLCWHVAAPFRIAPYPERTIAADPSLAQALPDGPLLGLSVLGGEAASAALAASLPFWRERLAPYDGWPVVPLPAEHPESPLDDLRGSLGFAAAVLPRSPVLLPELADPAWRRRRLTVARMRGLVARCAAVAASQDLPLAFAVAEGVTVLGLALGEESRAPTCLAALANGLAPGSALLFAPPGRG